MTSTRCWEEMARRWTLAVRFCLVFGKETDGSCGTIEACERIEFPARKERLELVSIAREYYKTGEKAEDEIVLFFLFYFLGGQNGKESIAVTAQRKAGCDGTERV